MKFALVGPTFPFRGGIAQHTTRLYNALSEKHKVEFYTFRRQYPRWLFPGKTDQDPSQHSDSSIAEPLLDSLNPLTWFSTAARIQAFHPDALILPWWEAFWGPSFATITRLVKRSKAKIVFVCHNLEPHEQRPGTKMLTRIALSLGDGFVVQSATDVEYLERLVPKARVKYVPHPIYESADKAKIQRLSIVNRAARLLFFGFVRPYKGLPILLDALPLVLKQKPVHLTVAGEFWESREKYERQILELGIQASVTLLDRYVPDEELALLFEQSDLVILPYISVTTSAALGRAIGHGVPVVVSDVGDLGIVQARARHKPPFALVAVASACRESAMAAIASRRSD